MYRLATPEETQKIRETSKAIRSAFINSEEDMQWLRDVHLPQLSAEIESAVIYGNEDCPKPGNVEMKGKLTELGNLLEQWGASLNYDLLVTTKGIDNEQAVEDFRAKVKELAEEAYQLAKSIRTEVGLKPW
jgi:hypothetical protein